MRCDLNIAHIGNHNILKHAVKLVNKQFIKNLVNIFDLDINFKDPIDGKTVFTFCNDEVARLKQLNEPQDEIDDIADICEYIGKVNEERNK